MDSCGNFLTVTSNESGIDVGYGKALLLFSERTQLSTLDLSADAINTMIANGTIVGVIKGWHTVAGASVAETNVERAGSGEMVVIRPEILADTLSFEATLSNREILSDLVIARRGSFYGLLVDDQGNIFGEYSDEVNTIYPMKLNFSGKTTSGLQTDRTSDKMISVTVRYLVDADKIQVVVGGCEPEDINSIVLLGVKFVSFTTPTSSEYAFVASLIDKTTGIPYLGTVTNPVLTLIGTEATLDEIAFAADGTMGVTLAGVSLPTTNVEFQMSMLSDEAYFKMTKVKLY